MQNRVEPPILLSRLLTLVFAATVVVSVVLMVTLYKMFPLDRPEIFFLRSANPTDVEITLTQAMPKTDEDFERYKRSFITEYIKARNEITSSARTMDKNWNMQDGIVRTLSTDAIFADFTRTKTYQQFMMNDSGLNISCTVEFAPKPVNQYKRDGITYTVDFKRFCTNSYGQTDRKDYTIKISIAEDPQAMKWVDHLKNPFGLRVTEYSVESGDGDPLD